MNWTPLSPILYAKILGGSGGSVTPASIVTATGQMSAQQKAETRANIGATDASTSIPDNVKQALLACFADVAWTDDQGQAHYDALEAALYPLDHITAVYTQSGTVYDTDSLDSLKTDLVVTAVYEGGNTETVPAANYTLSGTLTVGTSTITVIYAGKTATFDVTVVWGAQTLKLSNGDFIKVTGTTNESGSPVGPYYATNNTARRTFLFQSGTTHIYQSSNNTTFTESPYYLIPIKPGATSLNVSIVAATMYVGVHLYRLENGVYTYLATTGWVKGSATKVISEGATHISINAKYNSAGSAFAQEPSEVTVAYTQS